MVGWRRSDRAEATPVWFIAMAAALGLTALSTLLFTITAVLRLHVPLPAWDEWATVMDFRAYRGGTYGLAGLASQHNEHRLLFPRLFFFLDFLAFRLSGYSSLVVTILLQSLNAAIFVHLLRRLETRIPLQALLVGFVILMLFTLRQEQNFSLGFQLQFVGVFTAASLAAMAFVQALERLGQGRPQVRLCFALAALCCFVSAYTMANGVLAGFTLTGLALVLRAPWRVTAATLLFAAALATSFFWGYVKGGDSQPLSQALTHPLPYLRFVTAYLGNPAGLELRPTQTLGTIGMLLFVAALARLAWSRDRNAPRAVLLGISAFIVATACATAYGRIGLGSYQAVESRYATPALLFWTAQVLFWWPLAARPRAPAMLRITLAAVMLALVACAIYSETVAWPDMATQSTAFRRVSDSILSGLYDPVAADYETFPTEHIRPLLGFLRDQRLSVFASSDARYLGQSLAAEGTFAPPQACGGFISAQADPQLGPIGTRTSGSAWDLDGQRAVRRIFMVDRAGMVVGYGSAHLPGEPPREWIGYAKAGLDEELHAYARIADGRFCDLGATRVEAAAQHIE